MCPVPLSQPRNVRGFDGNVSPNPITHALYPILTVQNHTELTTPMLITSLGQHQIILGKPWMNSHGVVLDMQFDQLSFKPGACDHYGAPTSQFESPPSTDLRRSPMQPLTSSDSYERPAPSPASKPYLKPTVEDASEERKVTILKRPCQVDEPLLHPKEEMPSASTSASPTTTPSESSSPSSTSKSLQNPSTQIKSYDPGLPSEAPPPALNRQKKTPQAPRKGDINMISAAAYHYLTMKHARNKDYEFFAMSLNDINKVLDYIEPRMGIRPIPEINEAFTQKITLDQVERLLPTEFKDLLQTFDPNLAEQLPPHRVYDHKIELEGDPRTIKSRVYPMSYHKLLELKKYLDENLRKGFITASSAPFASPVLFATKPNGSLRFCVDYRKLNAITKRNRYPIPLIEETLAKVIGSKYLTKLDVIAAFNKLRMDPESEDLTTFITSLGLYKYKVLPFGLTNGPANYQHYMNDVLWDFINDFVQCYLDDILIYSKTRKQHVKHVRAVLERLRDAGLQVDITKSEFFVKETSFLGVIVSTDGIRMDPKKVQVVVDWMTPTSLKEVQGFLGFCNFYRRFIKDFAKIAKCMNKLAMKDAPFQWTEACDKAFHLLKERITTAPILRHFDRNKETILETDASDYVNGGVLSQYDDDGVLHPVAFFSKNMIPAECNYEIYDKELLAIIRCLEHWRPELESTDIPVKIFSDHKALETFMTSKTLTRRQARWAEILSEYNFKIMYQTGPRNAKADALTRMPGSLPKGEDDARIQHQQQVILTPERLEIRAMDLDPDLPLYARVMEANKSSDECTEFRAAIAKGQKQYKGIKLAPCSVKHGVLYYGKRVWVPSDVQLLVDLIRESHDPPMCGHPGAFRTMQIISRYYYWPNMRTTVGQYVRNCHTCRRSKAPNDRYNGLLIPSAVPEQRWQDMAMDFITGLPESHGNNAICTMVDKLSKERHYAPCHAKDEGTSAEATAKILVQYVFRTHGLPTSITSDRGPQFVALVWKSFCRRLGIQCNLSTAFHPETDGQSESANKEIETHLRQYCNYMQDDWSEWLPMAEFADNNKVSSAIGMSPFFANKGFNPRMTIGPDETSYESTRERLLAAKAENITGTMENILKLLKGNLQRSKQAMTAQANKHRKLVRYSPGDKVWLSSNNITTVRPSRKLEDKMLGPFEVVKPIGTSYRLKLPSSMKVHPVFHTSLLRSDPNDPLPGQITDAPRPVETENGDEWLVDEILDSRRHHNRLQYKVKWNGFERDNDWYNTDRNEFANAQDVVDNFHARYPHKAGPKSSMALRSKGSLCR